MPKTPSSKSHPQRTPLPPSMLDELEAMLRRPEFLRILPLRQSMRYKKYADLTEEEERERDAPRTKIRIAAMMEADDQWLSQSIQQIRKQGEAAWADEAVNGPWGDDTNTIPQNRRIPGDYSWDVLLPVLRRDFRQQQQQLGLVAMQRPRPHKVDKWLVCDLRKEGLTFWEITRQLFKLKGKTTYDQIAQRHYAKVRRAHRAARKLIHTLDK